MKREFLQLLHTLKDHYIGGYWLSTKLDGHRAYWDGGITRGLPCSEVPWANTEKDFKKKKPPVATGLWSRGGKAIQAHPDWLNTLPKIPLDGELWAGIGSFQEVSSIVRSDIPDDRWFNVKFCCNDSPAYSRIFQPGTINFRDFKVPISAGVASWAESLAQAKDVTIFATQPPLKSIYEFRNFNSSHCYLIPQTILPYNSDEAMISAGIIFNEVIVEGHEGIVIRDPHHCWMPERTNNVLRIKAEHDAEATVIGYVTGKGKHLGRMGALIVQKDGKEFKVSGYTDQERILNGPCAVSDALKNPGIPINMDTDCFKIGQVITFKYRELTDDGIPKEARYMRKRDHE